MVKTKSLKEFQRNSMKEMLFVSLGLLVQASQTFLRSLNLLEEGTKGSITVNGYDLTDKSTNVDHVRENIGMVFQHFNLFPHMTVLKYHFRSCRT